MGVASTEEETQAVMKVYSKEDYSVVNRFESMWALSLPDTFEATYEALKRDRAFSFFFSSLFFAFV